MSSLVGVPLVLAWFAVGSSSSADQQTDPHTLVEQYLHPDPKVAEALNVLKITPEEYSRVIASRTPRASG